MKIAGVTQRNVARPVPGGIFGTGDGSGYTAYTMQYTAYTM